MLLGKMGLVFQALHVVIQSALAEFEVSKKKGDTLKDYGPVLLLEVTSCEVVDYQS